MSISRDAPTFAHSPRRWQAAAAAGQPRPPRGAKNGPAASRRRCFPTTRRPDAAAVHCVEDPADFFHGVENFFPHRGKLRLYWRAVKKNPAQPEARPADPAGFERFRTELARLVAQFEKNFKQYQSGAYDEAGVRQEFLDPLFRALGWDVENKLGHIPQHREVELESRTEISGRQKRADYLFRTDRQDRFVCEAKKPAEKLHAGYAFQAKRYAWNKGLVLAVLSDFEEMKIYLVGSKPHPDETEAGAWKSWHFLEYAKVARDMWDLLSRDAVAAGSIEKQVAALPRKPARKTKAKQQWLFKPDRARAIDADFLDFLDEARRGLASDLIRHNDRGDLLEGTRLDEAVQRILDRLLFLRICEDRDIDTGRPLANILKVWRDRKDTPLWREIVAHFRALDRRPASHIPYFNGNLFKEHFSETLAVGDEWLSGFLEETSADESAYLFNVIPVEILGTIYERFLGKTVRPHGRGVVIEEKPEVRKAGGVYYTPRYIVDYIVEQTLGKLLEGKSPQDSLKLRVLDPACGSGSFLIRAYERLCEHWQIALTKDEKLRRKADCWTDPDTGDVHLTSDLKRRILTATIHGVDLDPGAVEVSQLSLYLKMLEGENRASLAKNRELFGGDAPLLPPLQNNIKCGNSLIASDFSLNPDDLLRVHAFDWDEGFREIMQAGGFDVVIGNPPYIRIQGFPKDQVAYFVRNYSAATGNYDLYAAFVERGLGLLDPKGRLGMILPNKFFRTDYGIGLRGCLSKANAVDRIVDFGSEQVFEATTYTCLLFLSRTPSANFELASSKASAAALQKVVFESRPSESLGETSWTFADERESSLHKKVWAVSRRLLDLPADMSRGSSSGDDETFVVEAGSHGLEPKALRTPLFASDFGRYFLEPSTQWQIIFPYAMGDGGARLMSSAEFQRLAPKAFAHLQNNGARLRERKQFKEWFGYSAPRNLELHERAQIAVPLLANKPTFSLIHQNQRGTLCPMASGGFTVSLDSRCPLKPEFVLGLLNSKLLFWFLRQSSNVFRGGWITCTKQYFGELPIVKLDLSTPADRARHDQLVSLVDKMLLLVPKLRSAKSEGDRSTLANAVAATDRAIDALVYELYGLTAEEIALVEGTAK
ncbi:MAG: hypothetical protein EOM72_06210 [Opitutae bacterium]|nr:hypothetical protein [Opitutae bacterium]